jgi:geranylgeranylglycerol-phosphate geranylgeranyltransferase
MYINGKLSALIKLIRPLNFLITFLSVIVAALISSEADAFFRLPGQIEIIFFAALSAAFTASAGYVINDYFDVNIDKINRPARPLASGIIKRNEAAVIYFFLFLASLALSGFVSILALLIVLTASSLLFLYSYK